MEPRYDEPTDRASPPRHSRRPFLTFLPEGRQIPATDWRQRHRWVLLFLGAHAVGLPLFGIAMGWSVPTALAEGALLAALAGLATAPAFNRRWRSAIASLGCVTSSAILVQFSHGVIEAHFHYFVVVALIALYQDWIPFLLAVGYVALDHGLIGMLAPTWVYNHPDALEHPWKWSIIHAVMVLGECASLIVIWKANEDARAQVERVLQSTRDGILGLDNAGHVTFANRSAATMLERSEGALLGVDVTTLMRAADGAAAETWAARAAAEGTLVAKDRPVEWATSPIFERGTNVGWVLTFRDTSERRDNVALREANQSLRVANDTLEAFSYVVGHDLKEPTRAIENYLDAAMREPDQERAKSLVQKAHASNRRLYELLRGLLEYARVSSHAVRTTRVDVPALLTDEVYRAQFEALMRERGAKLEILPELPAVAADEVALAQTMGNIILNAVKHNRDPDPRVVVRPGNHDARMAEILVEDNGKGFPPEIIQRFETIRSSRPSTLKGGFGLVVAHRAVQRMRGEMRLELTETGGARVRLRLPRA